MQHDVAMRNGSRESNVIGAVRAVCTGQVAGSKGFEVTSPG